VRRFFYQVAKSNRQPKGLKMFTDSALANTFNTTVNANRKYLAVFSTGVKPFNADNLKEAKALARDYAIRFNQGKLESVIFVEVNK
jgi:hypothetical protein